MHAKEAVPLGLCKALFGRPVLIPAFANIDPIIVALPVSAIVYFVVGWITKPVDEKTTKMAFRNIENS